MLGSARSISSANIVLNTAVAESLKSYADRLENVENFEDALHSLIQKTIKDHKRIIFNGNGYDDEWVKEAEKRGLYNLPTTPDAIPCLIAEKNVKLFEDHKVFTREELEARHEIYLESYCKTINIEALTVIEMVNRDILPSISAYAGKLCKTASVKKEFSADMSYEKSVIEKLSQLSASIFGKVNALEVELANVKSGGNVVDEAEKFKSIIIPAMEGIRIDVDEAEKITAADFWPYPSYGELLFGVN